MRVSTFLFAALLCLSMQTLQAQDDKSFNYQAVVRKASGELIQKTDISVKFSISDKSGTLLYSENQDVATDSYGVINLGVGKGSKLSGTFETIQWNSDLSLKVEVDYDKNGTTDLTGETKVTKVPSAYFSSKAGVAEKAEGLTYELATVATSGDYNDLKNKPAALTPTLTLDNYNLSISGGNTVSLAPLASYDNQQLSISGSVLTITGGNSVTLPAGMGSGDMSQAAYDVNTNNKVDVAENAEKIGGTAVSTTSPTTGQVLTYNGSIWAPAATASSITVTDNLISTSATEALSAKQGKTLNDALTAETARATTAEGTKVDKTTTVNGLALSGNITLTKAEVGLTDVDNTSDANKPVSLATQSAINAEISRATTAEALRVAKADAFGGDVTGTYDAVTVAKIQGTVVDATAPTNGQVLAYNGTSWIPTAAGASADEKVKVGAGTAQVLSTSDFDGTSDIVIKNAAITNAKLANDAVTTANIANATIATADIAPLAVDATLLAADAVTTAKIADGAVTAAKLSSMGATDAQILIWDNATGVWKPTTPSGGTPDATLSAKGTVQLAGDLAGTGSVATAPKITDAAITTVKLAADAVTTAKVADGTILVADLANDAVETAKIKDANVTLAKVQNLAATTLIGNSTGVSAAPQEITVGDGLAFDGTTLKTSVPEVHFLTSADGPNYTLLPTDKVIVSTAADVTGIILPLASTCPGRQLIVINTGFAGVINFFKADGATAAVIGTIVYADNENAITLISTGVDWRIISGF